MAYVASADFRVGTLQPWTQNLALGEAEGTGAYLDLVIAWVSTQVELDLSDDFEPGSGDTDETLDVDGSGRERVYIPRRVRSLTTVKTRGADGVLTTPATSTWRLHKSLNTAGTAMLDASVVDYLDTLNGSTWAEGTQTLQLVGKFGWTVPPGDIKRLVALRTYALVKATADPLTTILQRTTIDAVITYGKSQEEIEIERRYDRKLPVTIG